MRTHGGTAVAIRLVIPAALAIIPPEASAIPVPAWATSGVVVSAVSPDSAAAPSASMPFAAAPAARLVRGSFGMAVAVTGTEIMVGEPANALRPGTVYVYTRAETGWFESGQLRASDAAPADGFGAAIAGDSSTLVVGAASNSGERGAAYVFERHADGWSRAARLAPAALTAGDRFGSAVAVLNGVALVSAPGHANGAGAVYVFQRGDSGWSQSARLVADEEAALFGSSLALVDGRAFVGMPGARDGRGAVGVFEYIDGDWTQSTLVSSPQSKAGEQFGFAVAAGGGDLVIGAPWADGQSGAVHLFTREVDGTWTQIARLTGFDAGVNYRFGGALAADTAHMWIGAPTANGMRGAAYSLWRDGDRHWNGSLKLMPNLELIHGAQFGAALAARDGVVAVGLAGDDHGAGSVVVFERSGDEWRQRSVLKSPPERLASITGSPVGCSSAGTAGGFTCSGVDLLSFLSIADLGGGRGVTVNDLWGWTDPVSGKEYALIGRIDGTSFVDVSDPVRPVVVGNLPKTAESPASYWRDIKVYREHAYIVADGAGAHGMQVLDLTQLRNFAGVPLELTPDALYTDIHSAHNLAINEESGFAYVTGASSGGETCGGGLHMIDVRVPDDPRFVGCFADPQTGRAATGYTHDAQCVIYRGPDRRYTGREICMGGNETALSIVDVTDKGNARALSRVSYPDVGYAHQGWLTSDHRYFYMNDELDEVDGVSTRTRTLIWDVADLEDPQLARQHMGTSAASDHNLYVRGNLMYQSNYRSGLRILDVSDPVEPVEIGFFDTHPGATDAGFEGSWSNYPFFDSGIIIVSSIGEGLFILKKQESPPVF